MVILWKTCFYQNMSSTIVFVEVLLILCVKPCENISWTLRRVKSLPSPSPAVGERGSLTPERPTPGRHDHQAEQAHPWVFPPAPGTSNLASVHLKLNWKSSKMMEKYVNKHWMGGMVQWSGWPPELGFWIVLISVNRQLFNRGKFTK